MEIILLIILLILLLISVVQNVITAKKLESSGPERIDALLREEFRNSRAEAAEQAKSLREELAKSQNTASEALQKTITELGKLQQESIGAVEKRVRALADANEARMEKMRETMEKQLRQMQDSNEKRLEQMRATVDEKLQSTLEKRLGESFKRVGAQLEAVQRGLGEMQNLASDVGGLKRVLTNVKTRGTWGEHQVGDILEQILAPDQYARNVRPRPDSGETVEFAVRLPGKEDSDQVWLPIDAKFPQEDYQRLLDAAEAADAKAVESATKSLVNSIQNSAKDIAGKYLAPPHTTDFAILFLPTEGLYAEVLRQPGMMERLQQNHRVVITGPTTLAATLSSLRMGFRTLAIEKRSSEVWKVLSAVKAEFEKFGEVLKKINRQLSAASNTLEQTATRTRVMRKRLESVEKLPEDEASALLGFDDVAPEPEE